MSPFRVAALTRRIVAQFRRDRRTLALLFLAPLAIIALLGWVLGDTGSPNARVAIVNLDGRTGNLFKTGLEAGLRGQPGVTIVEASDAQTARQLLIDHSLDLAVVVPPDFEQPAAASRKVELLTLGLNQTAEAGAVGAVQRALPAGVEQFSSSIGVRLPSFYHLTVYGSPDASTLDTLAPVVVGFFAYFFVFILTGISFLRERIGGTLERLLATPVTRAEIVLGYSIGFGIFATLQVALVLAFVVGRLEIPALGPAPAFAIGLGVRTAGSPLLAYLLVLVLGLGAVSLGIFISTFARTEFQILQFIPIVIVPQGLLGGFFWPIDQLPSLLQPVARLLPVTYAVEGLRQVMVAGDGLASATVQLDLLVLVAIAAVFVVLASLTIRREVA